MSWLTQTLQSSLGKKYIMAVTGLLLGGFLLVHAAGNATIFFGRKAFLSYAEHLHSLGFVLNILEVGLLLIFLAHIVTGLLLFFQNNSATTSKYAVNNTAGGRSLGSKTMPYTGIGILIFIIIHLFNFHFTDHSRPIADIVGTILNNGLYSFIYALAMLVLGVHLSHGFWSLFQTLGINHPQYNCFIWIIAWIGCLLISAVFLFIVALLLVNSGQLV